MTHWGWYWKVKRDHTPKLCCDFFEKIDSFDLFKTWVRQYQEVGNTLIEMPPYKLKLVLAEKNCIRAEFENGSAYKIPIEEKPCNYGGSYFFFHCPKCDRRMRLLCCVKGYFLCRKCLNFGYYIQRLSPTARCWNMGRKIEKLLEAKAGTLERKPPWMKKRTFEKIKRRYNSYREEKYEEAMFKEFGLTMDAL